MTLAVVIELCAVVLALAGIRGAIANHTREVRAIAEERAERERINAQHAANVSARWQG